MEHGVGAQRGSIILGDIQTSMGREEKRRTKNEEMRTMGGTPAWRRPRYMKECMHA